MCFRKLTLEVIKANARLDRQIHEEVGVITQAGNDEDLKNQLSEKGREMMDKEISKGYWYP